MSAGRQEQQPMSETLARLMSPVFLTEQKPNLQKEQEQLLPYHTGNPFQLEKKKKIYLGQDRNTC